jgi:hypothetical protein
VLLNRQDIPQGPFISTFQSPMPTFSTSRSRGGTCYNCKKYKHWVKGALNPK